jgi:glycosyltransferase involved in cell wall biosynthesis
MSLGQKRNFMHEKCSGDIIVYMDDDDYYPPERVSHAVQVLNSNKRALCAGSSEMHIYFKHINKMYQFGPYGPRHAHAATFAFKKELLKITSYEDSAAIAEEKHFLKDYTIPFIQLDPIHTILVFSHIHNSFDKKELLQTQTNQFMKLSDKTVNDFIKEENIKKFFLNDIDILLNNYNPGKPEYKPDVLKQMNEIKVEREKKILEYQKQQQQNNIQQFVNKSIYEKQLSEQNIIIHQLIMENNLLKDKVKYLENKLGEIIKEKIDIARKN